MEVNREQLANALNGFPVPISYGGTSILQGKIIDADLVAGQLFDALTLASALTVSDDAKCTEVVGDDEDEDGPHECGKLSRFVVERSDGDKTYGSGGGTEEACPQHLADVVSGMVDGDTGVRAVVSIRWDA